MFRLLLAGLLSCWLCTPGRAAEAGEDVVVTVVAGTVTAGGKAVQFMDRLAPQPTVELGQGARLVLFRLHGALEATLTGPGTFAVRDRDIVRTSGTGTLQLKRMDPAFSRVTPGAGNLAQAGVTLRASAAIDPVGHDAPQFAERVAPGAPAFRWGARPHEGDYEFLLADAGDRILAEARQPGRELVLPDVRLAPGALYRWELKWRDPAGQMRMVMYRFGTLSAADGATLERLRPPPEAPRSQQVLFGWWLRSVGAYSLAERYLGTSGLVP